MKIKSIITIVCLFLFHTYIYSQCGEYLGNAYFTYLNDCPNENWELKFEDNFDTGQLDITKWDPHYPYKNYNGLSIYKLENLNVVSQSVNAVNSASGVLEILSKAEPTPVIGWPGTPANPNPTFDYSTGMIHSKDLFGYGKYEIRCRIPSGLGHWPAFWIFGKNTPTWQEIDFFEFNYSGPVNTEEIRMDAHYNPINQENNGNKKNCRVDYNNGTDFSLGFYTYTCIYTPTEIKWYLNGNLIRTMYKYTDLNGVGIPCSNLQTYTTCLINAAFPPGEPSNLIINDKIARTDAYVPDKMEIDYVKYWTYETVACGSDVTKIWPFAGTIKCKNALLTANASVNGVASITASNSITIQNNFKATAGNVFSAKIDPSWCGGNQRLSELDLNQNNQGDEISLSEASIYPNPNNGQFTVAIENNDENVIIQVFDLMGKQVFTENSNTGNKLIDISEQPKGIYLVKVTSGNQVFNEKIIYQ